MTYPGKAYVRGSMFRERDMGNLCQLLFTCDNYFRYKNIELVTDAHFGHLVPVAFLRLWMVYATCSFSPAQRLGISNLEELSKVKLNKEEQLRLISSWENEKKENSDSDSSGESDASTGVLMSSKKEVMKFTAKSKLEFFEKKMSLEKKGFWKV